VAITIAYALILPALLLVPRPLISTREGEALPIEDIFAAADLAIERV
jgi:hypothetical protein